jgi:hypothetical protein
MPMEKTTYLIKDEDISESDLSDFDDNSLK